MKLKILTALFVIISLETSAGWIKTETLGMYEIMNIEGSKIVDTVVAAGADKNYPRVIFTTMHTSKGYFRCAHDSADMAEVACYFLQKGDHKKSSIWG